MLPVKNYTLYKNKLNFIEFHVPVSSLESMVPMNHPQVNSPVAVVKRKADLHDVGAPSATSRNLTADNFEHLLIHDVKFNRLCLIEIKMKSSELLKVFLDRFI